MSAQAPLRDECESLPRGRGTDGAAKTASIGRNVSRVVRDVTVLAELQCQLLLHDTRAAARRAMLPLGALVAAGALFLGCVTLLLWGVSEIMAQQGLLTRAVRPFVVAAGGLAVALVLGGIGWWRASAIWATFDRSRSELRENLEWIKRALRDDDRA